MPTVPDRLSGPAPWVIESSPEDLAVQRYLLDLALQPLQNFEGFTRVEQLGLSALRYQLNGVGWALSLAQRTRTPAFTGYLAEAQRNVIAKLCDRRVWRYWAYENLAGYGRWNPDPITHHNVMYSGYLGVMIGLYETLNTDGTFSSPGALTLRWNDRRVYRYDFARLAQAVDRNMRERPDCPQYPCEPHLVFPICNALALNTLLMHDRLHATGYSDDLVERVRASYDRDGWRRPDGRFVSSRARLGRRYHTVLGPLTGNDAWIAYWLHATMPDLARDTWNMLRATCIDLSGNHIRVKGATEQRLDPGDYNLARGGGPTHAVLMKAAREMGDDEVANALNDLIHQRHPLERSHGAARHSQLSNFGNFLAAMGRFGGPGVIGELITDGVPPIWRTGPILAQAAYPDVLVAYAVTDGEHLDLILHPGNGCTTTTLALARLSPDTDYTVTGSITDKIRATYDGTARLRIKLRNRTEIRIQPTR